MKKLKILCVFILNVHFLFAQKNCFEDCWENFKYSNTDISIRGAQILQGLVGCTTPGFNTQTINGESISLEQLKGRIVVLNFWFTSCAPCLSEIPSLNKLVNEYRNRKDIVFLGFARDSKESLISFLGKNEFKYKVIPMNYELSEKYCMLDGWPTNMVIDKSGRLRLVFSGGFVDDRANDVAYKKIKPIIDKYLE